MYTDVKAYYNKKEEAIKQYIKETDPKLLEQESDDDSEYESEEEKSVLNISPHQNNKETENKMKNIDLNIEGKKEEQNIISNTELSNLEKTNKENTNNKLKEKILDNLVDNGINNVDKINQFFDDKFIKDNKDDFNTYDDIKIYNENNNLINETENLINTENTEAVNRKFSENLNSETNGNKPKSINEMKDIAPMLEKFEKKKKKKETVPEGPIK